MRFTKTNLWFHGGYVCYREGGEGNHAGEAAVVLARFKHVGGAGSFMAHLRKHWTVEAFLAAKEKEPALTVVRRTGYFLPHVKNTLRRWGYPVTAAGYEQYLRGLCRG